MKILEAKNIRKIYIEAGEDKTALNGINLTINDGEFIGIYGTSGSGKTTLLKILCGLIKPTSGEIYFEGNRIDDKNFDETVFFRKQHIGAVFSDLGLLNELTIRQNILLPLYIDKKDADIMKFSLIVTTFGLKNIINDFPYELSSGEKQRALIARAIINEPQIILLDEPTANLDRENRERVMNLLEFSHHSLGQTILIVSHDEEIINKCKRIIHIEDGIIVKDRRII